MITRLFTVTAGNQFAVSFDPSPFLPGAGRHGGWKAILRNVALQLTTPSTTVEYHVRLQPQTIVSATEIYTIRQETAGGFSELGNEVEIPTDADGSWLIRCTSVGMAQAASFLFGFTVEPR